MLPHYNKSLHIAIDFWLLLPIKMKLKEIMMAFVYKLNFVYIYSLHIPKFISLDQTVLQNHMLCF